MGSQLVHPPANTNDILLPAQRFVVPSSHWQLSARCRDFELEATECLYAYGLRIGETKCKAVLHDLQECATGMKMFNRFEILLSEFIRKAEAGEAAFEEAPFIFTFE